LEGGNIARRITLAEHVGTPKFEQDVNTLVEGVDKAAKGIGRFASVVGSIFGGEELRAGVASVGSVAGIPIGVREGSLADRPRRSLTGQLPLNNPGNLRVGQLYRLRAVSSEEAGLKAIANQLRIYQRRDHLDTIAGIVNK
jgi:hypothetical protein